MKKDIQRKMNEKPGMPISSEKRMGNDQELVTNKNQIPKQKRIRKERIHGNKN